MQGTRFWRLSFAVAFLFALSLPLAGAFDDGRVDETWLDKQQPLDPGVDYWEGARMQNPPCCDTTTPRRTDLQMVVTDVAGVPDAGSCAAFFASHGGGNYDGSTWTGPGAISIYLDAGEGKGRRRSATSPWYT